MTNDLLLKIQQAYDKRDLEALDKLAVPSSRELNTKNDFRSVLMLSSNNIKHLAKIKSINADCIMLNLEDGVGKEDKSFALVLCAIFLSKLQKCDKKLVVRVNSLDTTGYEEITYLNQFMPDAIRVPKIKTVQEVKAVRALLNEEIELHLSIETASAWHNLNKLRVERNITTFYLGILDLFADINLAQSLINRDNPTMQYMLSHFLITCKTMGIKPVSFVYQDFKNLDEFDEWLRLEKTMGYDSKGCISPEQALHVDKFFVNSEKELQRAKTIVKLFEMYQADGITGFVDDEYGFIDEPIYKGALSILANQ
jgi:citrate lyase subunit beta/citryl-CoA lyase